jgi:hypothetical protein
VPIRANGLARASQRRSKPNSGTDNQPTVDQQIARLQDDMRRLKVEFDIYFNGASKRPPYDTKGRVETVMKRLADDRSLTFAQRYLLNSLVARYTAFRELWRRTMKSREEGREPRHQRTTEPSLLSAPSESSTFVCADAHTDVQTVKVLYDALVEAKKRCNEPVDDLSFPRFHHMIANKTDSIKQHLKCDSVKFTIAVEDGRVNFKAKADKN